MVLMDPLVKQVQLVLQVIPEHQVKQEITVLMVLLVLKEKPDPRVTKAIKVTMELQAKLESKVLTDQPDLMDQLAHKAQKGLPDTRGPKDLQEKLESKAQQVLKVNRVPKVEQG
jgi:ssDNA-specific exonuclease RecJ